jgi:FMN reductase (NADPH)
MNYTEIDRFAGELYNIKENNMNSTVELLLNHRSIRKFKEERLSSEQIQTIIASAQAASTSSHVQAYTILGVTDKEKKQKLAELAGNQAYVAENGHFFIFCADLYRHQQIGEWAQEEVLESLQSTEKFMVAVIDAALAAQNATVAAESMGLGVCYIGGIRNNLHGVQEVLQIPQLVLPLFGLAVGFPDQQPDRKPRLPQELIYHEDTYKAEEEQMKPYLDQYDELMQQYYDARTKGKRKDRWTDLVLNTLKGKSRMYMKEFVEKQGFNRK